MNPTVDWRVAWPQGGVRFLLADCRSGLGNRMKTLVSAMRAASAMPGRLLAACWAMDGYHCHCPLHDLFTNPFLVLTPEFFQTTGFIDYHAVRLAGPNFVSPDSPADVVWVHEENFFYLAGDRGVMWGQHGPHRMPNPAIRDELLSCFDRLVPVPTVLRMVEDFARKRFAGRRVVGVHVRRGDNVWANRYVPTEMFPRAVRRALEEAGGDPALFVCSDDPQAEVLLRAEFGDRVLTFPKREAALARGSSAAAVQDALAEMYLLACTELIVRTPSSTFSQCASWLGRVPTVEVGPLEHDW